MARKSKVDKYYSKIEIILYKFLDRMRRKKRLELIDKLLHSLNLQRRMAMLTNEEMAHMCSQSLSPAMIKRLDEAATEEKRDEILMEYARSNYFRQCAWADYLNGVTGKKPFVLSKKEEKLRCS
ncbi:MAG: hypothetical protein WC349_03945 [Patescibacteria group bacterium]|jgi:hypothetical protein